MKKAMLLLVAMIMIATSCTKDVNSPLVKKNPDLLMRKRSRNPSLPPTPYLAK